MIIKIFFGTLFHGSLDFCYIIGNQLFQNLFFSICIYYHTFQIVNMNFMQRYSILSLKENILAIYFLKDGLE